MAFESETTYFHNLVRFRSIFTLQTKGTPRRTPRRYLTYSGHLPPLISHHGSAENMYTHIRSILLIINSYQINIVSARCSASVSNCPFQLLYWIIVVNFKYQVTYRSGMRCEKVPKEQQGKQVTL